MTPDDKVAGAEAEQQPAAFIWSPRKEFPAFLRTVREAAGLSLRRAALALGMTAAYLSRLETGGPARQPVLERLNAMAALYNIDRHAMYEAAGIHVGTPDMRDYTADEFAAIMLDPELQPGMITSEALNYFSPRMMRQVVELARNLVGHDDPAALLSHLLAKAHDSSPRPSATAGTLSCALAAPR